MAHENTINKITGGRGWTEFYRQAAACGALWEVSAGLEGLATADPGFFVKLSSLAGYCLHTQEYTIIAVDATTGTARKVVAQLFSGVTLASPTEIDPSNHRINGELVPFEGTIETDDVAPSVAGTALGSPRTLAGGGRVDGAGGSWHVHDGSNLTLKLTNPTGGPIDVYFYSTIVETKD